MGRSSRWPLIAFLAITGALVQPEPGTGQIYHWTDEAGTPHFTDREEEVPARHRLRARDIQEELRAEVLAHEGSAAPGGPPAGAPRAGGEPPDLDEVGGLLEVDLDGLLDGNGAELATWLAAMGAGVLVAGGVGLLLALAVGAAFAALMLILACRMVRTDPPRFAKAMGIATAQLVANAAIGVLVALLMGLDRTGGASFQGASFAWSFVVYAGVLHGLHGTSFGTSLLVSLLATLLTLGVGLALGLLFVCAGGIAALAA
jgi:hypothetical protein